MSFVTVEFYGVPRHRAGVADLRVVPGTVAEVLVRVTQHCHGLPALVNADGELIPHYLLSVNGERFVTSMAEELPAGSRLLLLSADAGG